MTTDTSGSPSVCADIHRDTDTSTHPTIIMRQLTDTDRRADGYVWPRSGDQGTAAVSGIGDSVRRRRRGREDPGLDHRLQRVVLDVERELDATASANGLPGGEDEFVRVERVFRG